MVESVRGLEEGRHIAKGWVGGGKFQVIKSLVNKLVVWGVAEKINLQVEQNLGMLGERLE